MAMDDLSEEERRALRGSKFAPLPSPPSRSLSRLAHPGGALKTNKAAALAKFLKRKLHQHPHGLSSIDPHILELAVRNAKATLLSSGTSTIRHVDTFDDGPQGSIDKGDAVNSEPKMQKKKDKKKKEKKKKNKRQQIVEDSECGIGKKPKKKLKL